MRLPHAHALYVHGGGVLHRAPAAAKVVSLVLFACAVAAIPRKALVLYAAAGAALLVVVAVARLRPLLVVRRLVVEVPFALGAVMIPFFGDGSRVTVLGVSLSSTGFWAAFAIVAKGTLCLGAAVVVTATTTIPDMLVALRRLRVPAVIVAIAGFAVRYLDVIAGEARRTRVAMAARGYAPRRLSQARPLANAAGSLFVRSHERAERVHRAMIARGYAEGRS